MPLSVSHLRIEMGDRVLLRDGSFVIPEGEKVALVGRNGQGKTTLLRALAGEVRVAGGDINLPASHAWLQQDTSAPAELGKMIAFEYLLGASRLTDIKHRMDAAQHAIAEIASTDNHDDLEDVVHRYADLEEEFRRGGGYEMESEAERVAGGVGLSTDDLLNELSALSGGQRRRLELARMLFRGGDLLILDEPTNHLDAQAKSFVMNFLRTTQSAVLVVSHDIELMNESIDRVFALDSGLLDIYKGTYSQYLAQKEEVEESRERSATNAQREIARLEKTKQLFMGANEVSSRKRKQFEGRIDKIKETQAAGLPVIKKRNLKIRFPDPIRAGNVVLRVENLEKGFEGETVFEDVNFYVERGESFIVIGRNGAGKTTLLRSIFGIYKPDNGIVHVGANVTLGFYAQEHEDIRAGASVIELMNESSDFRSTESELRALLGHFGLTGEVAKQEAATLSGGEKTKLSLARLVAGKANVLLLDEPTNNLDVGSREALAGALQNYKGTIVLVSHDLEFVMQLKPERAIVMPKGQLLPFDEKMLELVPST